MKALSLVLVQNESQRNAYYFFSAGWGVNNMYGVTIVFLLCRIVCRGACCCLLACCISALCAWHGSYLFSTVYPPWHGVWTEVETNSYASFIMCVAVCVWRMDGWWRRSVMMMQVLLAIIERDALRI